MRGWLGRALSLLALWLLAQAALAQDDPPGRVGRLAALQGEVWVLEPGRGEWIAALPNRPFTGGERLHTAPGASAELRIGSTTVFLGAQTEFEALRLDDERLQFRLQRGQMALRVPSPEVAAELEVLHPEARFRPLRAGFYRIDRLAEASDATVWRGALQVEAHNLSLTLQVGQRAAFWRDGPLGDTTRQWLAPAQDEFALAVQRQDQVLAQLAPSDLVPAEMTGAEDLQRYGSWTPIPSSARCGCRPWWPRAGHRTARASGSGSRPGAGPGSMQPPGALRPSTTAAGCGGATAGAGRRARAWCGRSSHRRWSAGSAGHRCRARGGAADRRRHRAGCRWGRVKPIARTTGPAHGLCSV